MIKVNECHDPSRPTVLQGDVALVPVLLKRGDRSLLEVLPEQGNVHIIAHSETGHHHVVPVADAKLSDIHGSRDQMLTVTRNTAIEHLREEDQHESQQLIEGDYIVRRQVQPLGSGFMLRRD